MKIPGLIEFLKQISSSEWRRNRQIVSSRMCRNRVSTGAVLAGTTSTGTFRLSFAFSPCTCILFFSGRLMIPVTAPEISPVGRLVSH